MTESKPGNIPYLDGWRGLAIVLVLIGHFGGSSATTWLGAFGVALFFALSGYLMCDVLFVKKVALPDFFARRISRVVPTFWLYTLIVVLASFVVPGRFTPNFDEVLAVLFFVRTYFPAELSIWTNPWPVGHIWSLNVEEHSYLFLAVLAVIVRRSKFQHAAPIFLLASVLLLLAFVLLYTLHPPMGASPWRLRSEVAAIGIVAAAALRLVFKNGTLLGNWYFPPAVALFAFVLAAVCISTYAHKRVDLFLAPLCLAFTVNQLDRLPAIFIRFLSLPVLRWFGRCSFSLYLWQQPFFEIATDDPLNRLVMCALAIGTGALSFYVFEEPARKYLNKAWDRRRLQKSLPAVVGVEGSSSN